MKPKRLYRTSKPGLSSTSYAPRLDAKQGNRCSAGFWSWKQELPLAFKLAAVLSMNMIRGLQTPFSLIV